jgi:TPR repeat protein
MTTRSAAILRATCFGLAALSVAPVAAAYAQSTADAALCDRVAADPTDPDKPKDVAGVTDIAPADVATAVKFCKPASAKSRRALFQLGRAYAANQQWPEALSILRQAADKGSTAAMVELGVALASGNGGAKDEAQAARLFERAAEAGNPRGVVNLAVLSSNGGAQADPARLRALLARAVDSNSAEALYQLGLMTAEGVGGPKDDAAARRLFDKAAAQSHPGALERMGAFAESGRGGPKDEKAAKAYYEKAVALGNEDAKAALKRAQCPILLKDKRGTVVSHLCF